MSKIKVVDLLGLSEFKNRIIEVLKSHTSNLNIHMSEEDRNNISSIPESIDNANNAASYANSIGQELLSKLENGELNGKDGVVHTSTGQFHFKIIDNDLYLIFPDGDIPRDFKINENGDLILVYDETNDKDGVV